MLEERNGSKAGPISIAVPLFTSTNELINSCEPQIAPAMQSFLPLMNLVMLYTVISAPSWVGATIIGVNQRDLHSFSVDTDRAARVAGSLPSSVISVCESGLKDLQDVQNASSAGFDAVLIGETFASAPDPEVSVRGLSSVLKSSNG